MITKAFVLGAALTAGVAAPLAAPLAAAPVRAAEPKVAERAGRENERAPSQQVRRGQVQPRAVACREHDLDAGRTARKPGMQHDDAHETEERSDD